MTNDKAVTISRELLEDLISPFADFATHDKARSILASPVVERQPVAIVDESDDGMFIEFIYGENGNPLQRGDILYAEQPAPVAVALNESAEFNKWWSTTEVLKKSKLQIAQEAWQARACLEKVKELNQ